MSKWKKVQIGDICSKVLTGGTPNTQVNENYNNGTIPWLKTKEVNFNRIYATENYITKCGLNNSSAKMVPSNSVIVAMYGQGDTAGRVAINKIDLCTNQACCNLVIDANLADYNYIYYVLKDSYDELVARKTGSAQPNLNTQLIKSFEISLPSLPEQKNIASILKIIDDKIHLLNRQNRTIEAMVETYFRQWFIEDATEDCVMGRLGDYVDVIDNRGKTPPLSNSPLDHPIIEVKSLTGSSRFVSYEKCEKYVDEFTFQNWFRAGHPKVNDILISTVGSIGEMKFMIEDRGTIAQNVVALRAKNISPYYLYQWLTLPIVNREIKEMDIGSVQPSIKVPHLLNLEIQVSKNQQKLSMFNDIMESINGKLKINLSQCRTLTSLRDTLLPKLISGELRVKM